MLAKLGSCRDGQSSQQDNITILCMGPKSSGQLDVKVHVIHRSRLLLIDVSRTIVQHRVLLDKVMDVRCFQKDG